MELSMEQIQIFQPECDPTMLTPLILVTNTKLGRITVNLRKHLCNRKSLITVHQTLMLGLALILNLSLEQIMEQVLNLSSKETWSTMTY